MVPEDLPARQAQDHQDHQYRGKPTRAPSVPETGSGGGQEQAGHDGGRAVIAKQPDRSADTEENQNDKYLDPDHGSVRR